MLIFSTHFHLELLVNCRESVGGGTFKCVCSIYQNYTSHMHGLISASFLWSIHILTLPKTEEGYDNIFQVLKQREPRINPISIAIAL